MELFLIGIPLAFIFPLICKLIFPHAVTVKEYILTAGVNVVCVVLFSFLIGFHATYDEEIWSGQVTKKYSERVSCDHSYSCNCRQVQSGTDSRGNATYIQQCDTCYEHAYDIDWVVASNIGKLDIDRVDRRGEKEPPRFSKVKIGEPFAMTRMFKNYIKASPNTLFKNPESLIAPFIGKLPAYPLITDYYHIQRVFTQDVVVDNTLNIMLNEMMRKWGPGKQANVLAVFLGEGYSQDYFQALQSFWLGGKKNDVVIVTQLEKDGKIGWTRVFSRAENAVFEKSIEMDVNNMGVFTPVAFVKIIDTNINERYKRMDFEQFKYLLEDAKPSTNALIIAIVMSLLINLAMSFFIVKQDVFGESNSFRRRMF